jgi:crotonobetainyl-CoA:carnitine CoA-transferase CaiB-like acyl-CoA transferase
MSNKDLAEDPHIHSRGLWVRIKPPRMKERIMVGPPFRFSKTPARLERPAPLMGEHNRYILGEILGFSSKEIDILQEDGVLY